jgi:multisubunit Na+/H+ antiporter MnhB subunit
MKMTKLVRSTANTFAPFCLIFGLYVVVHGHLSPGGGFQGGAVMATGAALLLVAHSYKDIIELIRKNTMKLCETVGLLMFITAGLSALATGGAFLNNWMAHNGGTFATPVAYGANPGVLASAGLIPILNIAVGIEVLGGLTVILLYMLSGVKEQES